MFINPRNITIYVYKSKKFCYISKFLSKLLCKIQILYNLYIYIYIYIYIIYTFLFGRCYSISGTDISTKILPTVHIFSLTIMTYLKMLIGIKPLNTKQCQSRLSPSLVKLSNVIGGRYPPAPRPPPPKKKERG